MFGCLCVVCVFVSLVFVLAISLGCLRVFVCGGKFCLDMSVCMFVLSRNGFFFTHESLSYIDVFSSYFIVLLCHEKNTYR